MLNVTAAAPRFGCKAVLNGDIIDLSWYDLHESKWLVLFFYPLDFTFVCPTEIVAFSDARDRFAALDAKVAAVSVDSAYAHLAWSRTPREKGGIGGIEIPLIADLSKAVAKEYEVLLDSGVASRALFIIDPKGIIRHATINDMGVGRNVDETLRVLEALQYVDQYGEVCPANWQPRDMTIVPDPENAQAYFASQLTTA